MLIVSVAVADEDLVVRTHNGNVFSGKLVEKVVDDHVTLVLATGDIRVVPWKDIDFAPPPPTATPPTSRVPPPLTAVRTRNGSIYYGEIIERVVGAHVTLTMATGVVKTIDWEDIDPSTPALARPTPREPPPSETVRLKGGTIYYGAIVEKVVRDHVTLRSSTGELKTIPWDEIELPEAPVATHKVDITFTSNDGPWKLERYARDLDRFEAVCTTPCFERVDPVGYFRLSAQGVKPTSPFEVARDRDSQIIVARGSRTERAVGILLTIASVPALALGTGLTISELTGAHNDNHTAVDVSTVIVDMTAPAILAAGIVLIATSGAHITVNGHRPAVRARPLAPMAFTSEPGYAPCPPAIAIRLAACSREGTKDTGMPVANASAEPIIRTAELAVTTNIRWPPRERKSFIQRKPALRMLASKPVIADTSIVQ
jgi:hypothetical protein